MLKLLSNISFLLFLTFFMPIASNKVEAHPLDQTHTQIYIATDSEHKTLDEKTGLLKVFISWQQMSYLHEKGENGVNEPEPSYVVDAFDAHMKTIYAKPQVHYDFILKNLSIKSGEQECKISELKDAKYEREEVLIGEGIEVDGVITCPQSLQEGIAVSNTMFFEDFPYQAHEIEVYLYTRLVARGQVDKNKSVLKYPDPSPTPTPSVVPQPVKADKRNLVLVGVICLLLTMSLLLKKNKTD